MNPIVIIPVYKPRLSQYEDTSFRRALTVLNEHPIKLVTHKSLDLETYSRISKEYNKEIGVEYFNKSYFKSLKGYNKLLMNKEFYTRFKDHDYMLIYQLDAYVFRDELLYWCNKGYDYIGPPWFQDFLSKEDGKELWEVGNGGFSLRNIGRFIEIIEKNDIRHNLRFYYRYFSSFRLGWIKRIMVSTINAYITQYKINEDYYFVYIGERLNPKLKTPDIETSIRFAFEKSPSYLYEINNQELPFGAHAFEKNQMEEFWSKHIL